MHDECRSQLELIGSCSRRENDMSGFIKLRRTGPYGNVYVLASEVRRFQDGAVLADQWIYCKESSKQIEDMLLERVETK